MNAAQAKEITQKNFNNKAITRYLTHTYRRIERAAKLGKYSIYYPFEDSPISYPSSEVKEAIWCELKNQGYTVVHHDSDPDNSWSEPYDEISWK